MFAKFEMKDLGAARYIFRMEITRDRENRKLWLSQSKYINIVLEIFFVNDCKQLVVPVLRGMEIFVEDCPKSPIEMEKLTRDPYASEVGSLIYAMVCTRPDISQVVGVLSHLMDNPGRPH